MGYLSKSTDMVVDNSNYVDEGGERTQVELEGWAAEALTRGKRMTKGVVAHECLLMASSEYSDDFTGIEQRVFNKEEELVEALNDLVQRRMGSAREDLRDACSYADPSEGVDADIYLVESVYDQLPYFKADTIEDAIAYAYGSPWSSRVDRLTDVQDLIEYRDTGVVSDDASEFVQTVIEGDLDSKLATLIDPNVDWYELSPSPMDLVERGEDIPKTASTRIPVVVSVWDEHNIDGLDYVTAVETLEKYFPDLGKDSYKNYADELVQRGLVNEPTEKDKKELNRKEKKEHSVGISL
mgnify:CR=1 FL=1